MHRYIQLGLIGALVVTVATVLTVSLLIRGDDDTPEGPTPTAAPSATVVVPTATATAVAPTSTPVPPTPTPTPQPPDAAAKAMALLGSEGKAVPADLSVASYERVTWPDASLDCPEPGEGYAQVETPGWRIIIYNDGERIEFHSDESGDSLFNCTERWASLGETINVYEIEGLAGTTLIEFERFDFEIQVYEKVSEEADPGQIQQFLDVLDGPVTTAEPFDCQPIFRLVFHTPSRESRIQTVCSAETRMITGQAGAWNGLHAIAPAALGDLIGPYYSAGPIPPLPDD